MVLHPFKTSRLYVKFALNMVILLSIVDTVMIIQIHKLFMLILRKHLPLSVRMINYQYLEFLYVIHYNN